MQLRPQEVAAFREKLLIQQKNNCPLCFKRIEKHEAALDHDHVSGHVRGTLHRNCNSVEGRVLHWARRSGTNPIEFLKALLVYWDCDYTDNPLHPNHKTPVGKKMAVLKKRLRKAKRASTKARIKQELLELMNG